MQLSAPFKAYFFFLACLCLGSYGGYGQSYSVSWQDQPLRKCLKDLRKQYKLDFAYNPKEFSSFRITLSTEANSIDLILNQLTEMISAKWEEVDGVIILLPGEETKLLTVYSASGVVREGKKGERLPGALVFFEPSKRSVTTNNDGQFYLEGAQPGDQFLVARFLGYKTKKVPLEELRGKGNIDILLEAEPNLLEEVTINENPENTLFKSQEISTVSFNQAKMNNFPTMGEVDPFRSVQLLPGIGSTDENLSGISIRGGSGDQSLILYDGFKIFHLDHFFGFISAFNAEAMKKINIYKGAYPSNYGGGASGIVEMNGKIGDPEKAHGSIGLNMLSAQASLEIPVSKKMGVFLAGRRSYTDILATPSYKKMMENVLNNDERADLSDEKRSYEEYNPDFFYYDINGKVSFRPGEKDFFTLTIFNSQDNFKINNSEQLPELTFETENRTSWGVNGAGLSWFRNWNKSWFSQTNIGFSNYFSVVDYGALLSNTSTNQEFEETIFFSQQNDVVDLSVSWDNQVTINPKNQLKFGLQYQYNFLGFEVQQDSLITEEVREDASQPTIYIEDVYQVFQRLLIKGGARAFHYSLTNTYFVEPRFSLNYSLTPTVSLKGAFGVFHQNISRVIRRDVFASNPAFWVLSDGENIPTIRSIHYILGTTLNFGKHFKADVEAYFKDNEGLVEYFPADGIFAINQSNFDPYYSGDGFVLGVDILLQAQAKNHSAWTGITIASQQEKFQGLNNGEYFPSSNDQRVELKIGYLYQWKNWEFSAVWIFGSGKPYTAPLGTVQGETPSGDTVEVLIVSGINSERLPDYNRLDLSGKYTVEIGKTRVQLGLSLFNAYNRTNIKGIRFLKVPENPNDDFPGGYRPIEVEQLGILPGVSLKVDF